MAKKRSIAAPAKEVKDAQKTNEAPAAESPKTDAAPAKEVKDAQKPVFDAPLVDIIKIKQFKRNNPRLYKLLIDEYEATKGGAK